MTNSRNKAIPSSTYVPVTIDPTIPWQVKIWSVSFQYAPHIHDDVSLSSPLKRIERNILQLLPVSEVLYSTDLTYRTRLSRILGIDLFLLNTRRKVLLFYQINVLFIVSRFNKI